MSVGMNGMEKEESLQATQLVSQRSTLNTRWNCILVPMMV